MKSPAFALLFPALLGAVGFLALSLWARDGSPSNGASPDETIATITKSLNDFLTFNSDPAQHDRFWADDLVYTSAAGLVKTKAEIMQGMKKAAKSEAPQPASPTANYSAEDIRIRVYGETAALTFRLVAQYPDGTRMTYRNSGTLLYRAARWQVITWQATKELAAAK